MKLLVPILTLAVVSTAYADPLPANRRIDWTYTGVPGGIPNRTTICATFNPGATSSAIQSALNACNNGVVKLNAGTFSNLSLTITSSNVTLRGQGDSTVVTGCSPINIGNGSNIALGVAITGAVKGATSFTAASVGSLAVGQMIELERDNDASIPVWGGSNGSRAMQQDNLITSISGNVVGVKNPLVWDYSTGNPKIKQYFTYTGMSGVENLKIDHSSASGCGYNFVIQTCYACWLKGVHSFKATTSHVTIFGGTLNTEIRDSFIDQAQNYGSNQGGVSFYGAGQYGQNSSFKFENNICNRVFPCLELANSVSGNYIGYNYIWASQDAATGGGPSWTLDDNHGAFNMMNLFEGNISEQIGADGYFGGSGYGTLLRNYVTSWNPFWNNADDAVRLLRGAYNYNIIGNVLGSALSHATYYDNSCGSGIYALGYPNIGNCDTTDSTNTPFPGKTYPDAVVRSSLLRWGNYDYFNNAVRFVTTEVPSGVAVPTDHVIPASYYYASRPSWWPSTIPWPPIGPDVTGGNYNVAPSPGGETAGHVNKIPAQVCFETYNLKNGGAFNAATCYVAGAPPPPKPNPPSNLTTTVH